MPDTETHWYSNHHNLAYVAELMFADDWDHTEVIRMLHAPYKYEELWVKVETLRAARKAAVDDLRGFDPLINM